MGILLMQVIDQDNTTDQFRQEILRKLTLGVRLGAMLVAFAFFSFAFVDSVFEPGRPDLLLQIRIILVCLALSICLLSFIPFFRHYLPIRVFSYLLVFISGGGVAVLTLLTGGSISPYWAMIILTFFGASLLFNFSVVSSLIVYLSVFIFYDFLLINSGEKIGTISFISSNAGILLSIIVSTTGSGYLRLLMRRDFESRRSLNKAYEELSGLHEELRDEKEQSERLLLNVLPAQIAARLRSRKEIIADRFEDVTILFADIVGFTTYSDGKKPDEIIIVLNQIFSIFDELTELHNLEKIKTVGDAYMVVGGLPNPQPDHARSVARMALQMLTEMRKFNARNHSDFHLRIGINSGEAVAGVIGNKKFIYDIWGDSVNIASRMESTGIPDRIQMTESTRAKLGNNFGIEERGIVQVKGKKPMRTFFLNELQTSA